MDTIDSDGPSALVEPEEEPLSFRPGLTPSVACLSPESTQPFLFPPQDRSYGPVSRCRARPRSGPRTKAFRKAFYPSVPDALWNDWRWQLQHRVKELGELDRILVLSEEERRAIQDHGAMLPFGTTPYYLSLVDRDRPDDPLRRTVIPTVHEFCRMPGEADDPLDEEADSPVPGLVHRYPDRVLLLAVDTCASYCRYCTRSRLVGHGRINPQGDRLSRAIDYIRRNPSIRDVLLSGGDPLILSDERLEGILRELRSIRHVEIIRIGTKVPVVLPQRITSGLCRMLRKFHPLWMSLHFTHPGECTPETFTACERLADAGIPLGSQTVLLRGINDDVTTMTQLMHLLLRMRVRPYYLYQCDPISGSAHFRTPVAKGLEILEGLRGYTSGYAIPTFVIDCPGGGGKVPLQPHYVVGREGNDLLLRNYEGKTFRYPDPTAESSQPG